MALSITDNAKKLWDAWNIRGLIILSLSLQAFLILFAPLRKGRFGRKFYVRWPIWFAYLSADWVATYTIGLIFDSNCSTSTSTSPSPPDDILVFWASFLLLHLGGPDNITSYALEDNEFWKRHLYALLFRVGFTLSVFLKSFSENKIWLPTILVLFAGGMKYAERTLAFYRASLDHFGENWVSSNVKMGDDEGEMGTGLSIPVQFQGMEYHRSLSLRTTVQLFGNIKRALVGPLLREEEQKRIKQKLLKIKRSRKVLQVLEIELSLLYEVLHTKLPVMDSQSGSNLRMANFVCMLLAIIFFSLAKRHYQLGEFDMLLTYGLPTAALALDFLSFVSVVKYSDWFAIAHFQDSEDSEARASKVIERGSRWSNEVSQLNLITYHVKDMPVWLNKLVDILPLSGLLKDNRGFCCESSKNFEDFERLWHFIFLQLKYFPEGARIKEVWLESGKKILKDFLDDEQQEMIGKLDYTQSLLVWHIATELCYHKDDQYVPPNGKTDYRPICKLLSDYMFYLAVRQPTMMATVLDNWNKVFEKILDKIRLEVHWSFFSNEKTASTKILKITEGGKHTDYDEEAEKVDDDEVKISLFSAAQLAHGLMQRENHCPWKEMSKIWVELMCYAAINCRPNVHAQQPSQGGELLTLVWLLMNHLGLGTKYYTPLNKLIISDDERDSDSD